MLEEILNTRIMVKQSMKTYKQDKALLKLLDARQLGLKLIANVTFGYTAASYSGRMPSVEVSLSAAAVRSLHQQHAAVIHQNIGNHILGHVSLFGRSTVNDITNELL